MTVGAQVDVSQGLSNSAAPTLGTAATIFPAPLGFSVNPNPVSLAEVAQLWGFRRDLWSKQNAAFAGTTAENASWFVPVSFVHSAASLASGSPCAFHFKFDGSAFEVLFAGQDVFATLIVDGAYASERYINHTLSAGTQGAPLSAYNTYVRFDLGHRAPREISLYCRSTLGPSAIAVAAGDTLQAWDRSAEVSMAGQADSYGTSRSAHWADNGIFFEAAMRLGIPHVDFDAIGGTGYAPNNVSLDPGNSFPARLQGVTRAAPDLFVTAGGINDNNSLALAPYTTADAARLGFESAVNAYFTQLRARLPESVLVALGPWLPNATLYPEVARSKAAVIKAALQAVSAPWIYVDNLDGGWLNSTGAMVAGTGAGWQTGSGNEAQPHGDGNADLYVSPDATHPNEAGCSYLGGQLANSLKQAIRAL